MADALFNTTYPDNVHVPKSDIRALFRDRIPQRYVSEAEVASTDTDATRTLYVDGVFYEYDPTDTVSAPVAGSVLVSADGNRYKHSAALSGGSREVLGAARSYYVDAAIGSDANDGLSPSIPFLTIQKAVTTATDSLDPNGFQVTINVAAGTYNEDVTMASPMFDGRTLALTGDPANPGSVIINGASQAIHANAIGAQLQVDGFRINSGSTGLQAGFLARVVMSGATMQFGDCALRLCGAVNKGTLDIANSTIDILGDGFVAFQAVSNSDMLISGNAFTFAPGLRFSLGFLAAQQVCAIKVNNNTYTGTHSGRRLIVSENGVISTSNETATALPGAAGDLILSGGVVT